MGFKKSQGRVTQVTKSEALQRNIFRHFWNEWV
jgi:hypothetical protein